MLLAIDIGNTNTDFGVFEGKKLLKTHCIRSKRDVSRDEYLASFRLFFSTSGFDLKKIDQVIIASVVPSLTEVYSSLVEKFFHIKPTLVGPGLKSGLRLKVDEPRTVGADLIAVAVGAKEKYGNDVFIADLGTALKCILLDEDGAFSGVSIGPGLMLSYHALVDGTASLPEVNLAIPEKAAGKNTQECMNSGLLYGIAFAIQGFAERFEKECGRPLKRILTGGDSYRIASLLPEFTHEPNLLLEGLAAMNERKRS